MRKIFLLVLPCALAVLAVGCDQSYQASSATRSSSSIQTGSSSNTSVAQAPAPAPMPSRSSTTQPLPNGWGYMHEQDLSQGPLRRQPAAPVSTMPTTTAVASSGGI